jgi:phosphoglycerate dehydrogenase-like enzyme
VRVSALWGNHRNFYGFDFGALGNVRMTPHSAAWTDGIWLRRAAAFADNIARLRAGRPLLNVVRAPEAARRATA